MKKVFFFFSLAFTITLFSAFTPTETITTDIEIKAENSAVALLGTGRLFGCYAAGSIGNIDYRLEEQLGPGNITGDVDCIGTTLTLDIGEWELLVTSDIPAYVVFNWEFCGQQGQYAQFHPGGGVEVSFTSLFIPC